MRREAKRPLIWHSYIGIPINFHEESGIVTFWSHERGVTESWTWLSDFTFTFHFHALEKEMATYSIILAWRIPGTVEPGGLPSMGSHRVGHDWSDLAAAATADNYLSKKFLLLRKCQIYTDINPWGMGQSPKRRVDSHPISGRDILKYKMRLQDAPPNSKPLFK